MKNILKFILPQLIKYPAIICILLMSANCARFRINELKPGLIFSIPVKIPGDVNTLKDSLLLKKNDHVIHGLPLRSMIWNNNIVISDYSKQIIKLYKPNQYSPFAIIGKDSAIKRYSSDIILKKIDFQ